MNPAEVSAMGTGSELPQPVYCEAERTTGRFGGALGDAALVLATLLSVGSCGPDRRNEALGPAGDKIAYPEGFSANLDLEFCVIDICKGVGGSVEIAPSPKICVNGPGCLPPF
jgi:hypothetical protein